MTDFSKKDIMELYFDNDNIQVSKNELIKINRSEFLIKNCEPISGLIVRNNTKIEIENSGIPDIHLLHLAIVKNDKIKSSFAENEILLNEYIHKQIYKPYFLSGISRYIERGDHFKIDEFDFFVLNCNPIKGFVHKKTGTSLIFGLSLELCQKKIKNADQKYADYLSKQYEIESIQKGLEGNFNLILDTGETININLNLMNNEEFNAHEIIIEDNLLSQNLSSEQLINSYTNCDFSINTQLGNSNTADSRAITNNQLDLSRIFESINVNDNSGENSGINNSSTSNNTNYSTGYVNNNHSNEYLYQYDLEMFLYSLPEISIDNSYLKYIDQKKIDLENITKCMICYSDFEINETIKTLPCSKTNSNFFSSFFPFYLYFKVV